jgi:outer membrane protein assembly factor BamD
MRRSLLILFLPLLLTQCGDYNSVLRSKDMGYKFTKAKEYYDNLDYHKSIPLFNELLTHYRGQDSSEVVYYYYAYSHYGMGDFVGASYHFKNFTENFYNSIHLEECYFMHALCEYKVSLPYYLDQTSTKAAIEKMQLFINLFPESKRIPECNAYIDELRAKLQKKAYESSLLFFKMGDYVSAVSSFKNTIRDYPDLKNKEEAEYMVVQSSYLLAKLSIESKQKERYESVVKEFEEIETTSPYYEKAKDFADKSREALNKL